jgi:dolichol-phosphate mannosyltransferase
MVGRNDLDVERAPHLVVVVPVYNEARSLGAVLDEIHEAAARLSLSAVSTSIVVVDDESPDGTGDIALDWAHRYEFPLHLVSGPRRGLGVAMIRGFEEALKHEPSAVVTLDGDGQHNPADIPTLYRAFAARRDDIVVGSRWTRGGRAPGTSPVRNLGSRVGNWAFRVATGTRGVRDATTSFRVYSPRVVEFLLSTKSNRYEGYSFFSTTIALAEAAGFSISEVPIEFRPRYCGQSKLNRTEALRYFTSLPVLRKERRMPANTNRESPYGAMDELELLSDATSWNHLVVDRSLLGGDMSRIDRILEVGAGRGGVTAILREQFPEAEIVQVEPDPVNLSALRERFADDDHVTSLDGTLDELTVDWRWGAFDLAVYVNVLEHIDDDVGELRTAAGLVRDDGLVAVVVPALSRLYGPIDAKSGHFRRYSSERLRETAEEAGLEVVHIGYLDRLGILPYWWNYRVLNKASIASGSVWAFDKVFVPAVRLSEPVLRRMPLGKNLVCLARRSP